MKFRFHLISLLLISFIIIRPISAQYQLNYSFLSADSGKSENYSSFQGKPLLIDTFATWCEPCKTEIIHIKEVNNQVGDQVKVLTISVSSQGRPDDDIAGIKKFRDTYQASWEFGLDINKSLTSNFNITTLPSLLLFDQNGTLVQFWEGITSVSQINKALENKFGITVVSGSSNDAQLLVNRLVSNLAFQITLGFTFLLTTFIIISNIINRKAIKVDGIEK